jgi:hypothetical protein
MRRQILSIEGIAGIHEWKSISGTISYGGIVLNSHASVFGYTSHDTEKLMAILSEGTADYRKLTQGDGLIICSPDTIKEFYGWKPQLGDTVRFSTLSGAGVHVSTELTVICVLREEMVISLAI